MTIITITAALFLLGTHAVAFMVGRILGRREGFPRVQKATLEYLKAYGESVGLTMRHGETTEQFRQRIKDQLKHVPFRR